MTVWNSKVKELVEEGRDIHLTGVYSERPWRLQVENLAGARSLWDPSDPGSGFIAASFTAIGTYFQMVGRAVDGGGILLGVNGLGCGIVGVGTPVHPSYISKCLGFNPEMLTTEEVLADVVNFITSNSLFSKLEESA